MNDEKIQKIREAVCTLCIAMAIYFFICGASIAAMCVLKFLGWVQ